MTPSLPDLAGPTARRPLPSRTPRLLLLASTALMLPLAAAAQDSATPVELRPIQLGVADDDAKTTVAQQTTASTKTTTDILDTPASVSVVTSAEIAKRGAQNLEQVIGYTAGVSVNEWGGDDRYDGFRIRGFDLTGLGLLYRDGLPQRGAGWSYARREPYGMERVEVLKGANSSLFGLSAPGGLVNAVSKTPKTYRFGEVYSTLGADHAELGFDIGDRLTEDSTLSYRLTGKWQDSEYSYGESNDDRAYLQGGLTWRPTDATTLTLLAEYNKRDGVPGNGIPSGYGIDRDTFLGEPEFNKMDSVERSVALQFSHDFGDGLSLSTNARYSLFNLDYEQVYGASATDPDAARSAFAVYSDSEQFAMDSALQYETLLGGAQSRTLLGLEYSHISVDENAYFGSVDGIDVDDPDYCDSACTFSFMRYYDWTPEQTNSALYLQEELTWGQWIATAGLRKDWIDFDVENHLYGTTTKESYEHVSGRFGLTYKVTPELAVYGNYSESFSQDVWGLGGDPTEGTQYEVGVKYRPEGTNALFTAALFDLTQTNVSTAVSQTEYRQIGEIGVRGLELEAKLDVTERFGLLASYSYWDAEIREDGIVGNEGNRPARTPEHLASVWADYTIPGSGARGDIDLGAGIRYVGSTWGDDANTVENDAYTLVDASIGYALADNVDLNLNVSNLFDEDYVTTTYYGTDYYGDGRTVTATLKYSW
ncbi:TonB-dependent siderophore receptor [Salipiger mangrovisoli]|uniref:TonB-dependent siderophore receptor n=1 Tax=Salipiger mangrovisoli TaxID=2865933 RepID=A0ABR9X581_9RHOB|nr:TonB-dependent siderophore receptor [Salipiger mangrovisoli]MBE9638671.1 TonB-dependent siderophore receptor [Salipiger mangrovisoli]